MSVLIEALHEAGQRLEHLTAGEVDTVADRHGQTFLLRTAQDHLRHIEADKQAAILNALPASIALLDTQGQIVSVNEAWRQFAGANVLQSPGSGIGLNYLDICDRAQGADSAEAHEVASGIRSVLSGEVATFSIEYPCHSPTAQRWFLLTVTPLTPDRPNGVVVMHLDITARKRGEEEIRRFAAAMDALADAVLLVDRSSMRIVHANDAACRYMNKTREQLLTLDPWFWLSTTRAELERTYDALIASGVPAPPIEILRRRKDGSERWVELRRHATRSEDRWIIVTIVRDITERKRAEQEILDLNASLERRVAERTLQLEQASRAKSDFVANMSHELRTPLNSIIGFSEMMKDGVLGELDAKQRGFVTDIFDAGTHLLSLINDVLDLSKVEAGMLQLESSALDVAALLMASTLVVRERALTHRIRLDTRLDPGLGIMLADERKLKQIVYNLLSNAVKFTPDGGAVTLRAHRCARAALAIDDAMPGRLIALPPGEHNEFLAISVEDSGVGIAEEFLPKLFEPFTQVDNSNARHQEGTGLGLSLVRRLAELHGGTVGVASRPGAGSRFSVWLPWRAAAYAAQAERTLPAGNTRPASAVPRALVIEDDDRMAELITAQLRADGFRVIRTATAEEGLVHAAKWRPQLITLDIFLPATDGWDFMRRLKADPKLVDTPVLIITASEDLERGLGLGARVLQKPFAREALVAALAGLVDASHSVELRHALSNRAGN